jgi:WD40-like Beta Propeller Repeat
VWASVRECPPSEASGGEFRFYESLTTKAYSAAVRGVLGSIALVLLLPAATLAATPSPQLTSTVNQVSLATGHVVPLAPDTDVNERIAGTPGGGRVAFTTAEGLWLSNGSRASARLLSAADGTTSSESGTRELAWSGDGRRLAIGTCVWTPPNGTCTLRVSVLEISTGRRFTLPFPATSPSLSPDGLRILVAREPDGPVVLATVNGQIVRRFDSDIGDMHFAPRGRLIAYRNSFGLVCVMRDDEKKRRCFGRQGRAPSWSADGSKLAFEATSNWADFRIAIAHVRTSHVAPLVTRPDVSSSDISWSPDGRQLAFGGTCLHVTAGGRTRCAVRPQGACDMQGTAFLRRNQVVFTLACLGFPVPRR